MNFTYMWKYLLRDTILLVLTREKRQRFHQTRFRRYSVLSLFRSISQSGIISYNNPLQRSDVLLQRKQVCLPRWSCYSIQLRFARRVLRSSVPLLLNYATPTISETFVHPACDFCSETRFVFAMCVGVV